MKTIILFALASLLTAPVHAKDAPKPAVCSAFRVLETPEGRLGVCYDGKKPAVWSTWTFVEIADTDGARRRVAVGFR